MGLPEDATRPDDMPEPPEEDFTIPPQPGQDQPAVPQGTMPQGEIPDGTIPMGTMPQGEVPPGGFGGFGGFGGEGGEKQTLFFMQDKVNFFTGLIEAE